MKRLFVLSLVAVLSVGLLSVGAFAQVNTTGSDEDDASTSVYWNYTGVVECEVSVDAHSNVDLGTIETVNTTMASNVEQVTTEGNCAYELSVQTTNFQAPGDLGNDIFDDFNLKLDAATGPNIDYGGGSSEVGNWTGFPSNGNWNSTSRTVGEYTGNDEGNFQSATWNMLYRYETDQQDANGYYQVDLQYTVATN